MRLAHTSKQVQVGAGKVLFGAGILELTLPRLGAGRSPAQAVLPHTSGRNEVVPLHVRQKGPT